MPLTTWWPSAGRCPGPNGPVPNLSTDDGERQSSRSRCGPRSRATGAGAAGAAAVDGASVGTGAAAVDAASVVTAAADEARQFDAGERGRLAALADALIPAAAALPSAGEAGVADRLLDQVLAARPDLAAGLHRALVPSPAAPAARLAELAADRPALDALELVVAGGYYLNPAVRLAIGYPGQEARTLHIDRFPDYVAEGLLDGVTAPAGHPPGSF